MECDRLSDCEIPDLTNDCASWHSSCATELIPSCVRRHFGPRQFTVGSITLTWVISRESEEGYLIYMMQELRILGNRIMTVLFYREGKSVAKLCELFA